MAYIRGEREQTWLMPPSVEEYIPANDPVRAYDAFVDALDLNELGFALEENGVGHPEFDPTAMVKLLVYGYSYGLRSSRKIERACHHNLSFIWLTGNLRPDHKTICRFRRDHRQELARVLKQGARLCVKLKLVEGNTLFVDGTKIKANASVDHTWSAERCETLLKATDERIENLLNEIEQIDQEEEHRESMVQMEKDLENKRTLKSRVQTVLEELKKTGDATLNTTDPECAKVKDKQTFTAGYNLQTVVDDKHGLIVHADVVDQANDLEQFEKQVSAANNNIGGTCQTACADAGYANTKLLDNVDALGVRVVVPSQRQALKEDPGPFSKDKFLYDKNQDCYVCPIGETLLFVHQDKVARRYQVRSGACASCVHFGVCTSSRNGRIIGRLHLEEQKEKFERQYRKSRHIFQRRKEKAELPFGHIKHNLGARSFLLRGLAGAKAEASLLATAFNMVRMISLLGVQGLIQRLSTA